MEQKFNSKNCARSFFPRQRSRTIGLLNQNSGVAAMRREVGLLPRWVSNRQEEQEERLLYPWMHQLQRGGIRLQQDTHTQLLYRQGRVHRG